MNKRCILPALIVLAFAVNDCYADRTELYPRNNPRYVPVEDGSPAGSTPVSLMIAFHGLGSRPADILDETGLADVARDRGFILAAPEGRGELIKGWAAGQCCLTNPMESAKRDDVDFVNRLIADLKVKYPRIDLQKIYLVGFSNGGILAHRLAYQLKRTVVVNGSTESIRIAGIATLASSLSLPVADRTPNVAPIPWGHFHGTADDVIDPAREHVVGQMRS